MKKYLGLLLLVSVAACNSDARSDSDIAVSMVTEQFSMISQVEPLSPPKDELIAYLHREFGESPDAPDALQAKDLTFFGTLQFADRIEHIWKFPCSSDTGCWLRVTEGPSGGATAWSVSAPPGA